MKIQVQRSERHPVAEGQLLKLLSIKPAPAKEGLEPAIRFDFQNVGKGEHAGLPAVRLINVDVKPDNVAGKFLAGMLGVETLAAAEVDLDTLIGGVFLCDIAIPKDGTRTRVERAVPAADEIPF